MTAQPLTKETANPNAATAAASAFMRRDPKPTSLSSAAAAAALKARPITPTNVAEVQSKRVVRRSASVSSSVGRGRNGSRSDLRRVPSNSSMTERTFRSPSPSPGRSPLPSNHDVPPVPSLPNSDHMHHGRQEVPSHRKTMSLQTQPLRTASQKMKDGQGSWFGAAAAHDISNVRTSDAVMHNPEAFDDRSGSISPSINFSYPRGLLESPVGSPRPASVLSDRTLVYDANSRRMVPQGELMARQQAVEDRRHAVQEASEKPVKKKKQNLDRTGSHLTKGTVGRTQSATIGTQKAAQTDTTGDAQSWEAPRPVLGRAISAEEEHAESMNEAPTAIEIEEVAVDELELRPKADRGLPLGKDTSGPGEEPHAHDVSTVQARTPAESVIQSIEPQATLHAPKNRNRESVSMSPTPKESKRESSIRNARVHSESPARTAHFGPSTNQLVVRHSPPPRSLSPRKSALKQSSPRPNSPSEDGSDVSTAISAPREESVPRKKSVRVSFNDQDTVVGESAGPGSTPDSPVVASPQVKKPWHSIIGRHKKDALADDDDEKMTPRPALPAFGSVRDKKPREADERPLVRPAERTWSPTPAKPSSTQIEDTQLKPTEEDTHDLGPSSDHQLGSILAQENALRNEANTSRYREPLPPVVTSMEHSGYISNSPMSSDDESDNETSLPTQSNTQQSVLLDEGTPETTQELDQSSLAEPAAEGVSAQEEKVVYHGEGDEHPVVDDGPSRHAPEEAELSTSQNLVETRGPVPAIAVSLPTPVKDEDEKASRRSKEYFGVPGCFPDDDTSESSPHESITPFHDASDSLPSSTPTPVSKRPPPIVPVKIHEAEPSTPSPQMDKIQEEKESSDDSAVFSDAYEDLSDVDGDGFLSLDAVLTTPTKAKVTQKLFEKTVAESKESIAQRSTKSLTKPEASHDEQHSLKTVDEWEQAKAYWKNLTADKRRQLELEAMEEAGEEADREAAQKPKKAKKRRSLDAAPATAVRRHPDRTYQIQPGTKWTEGHAAAQSQSSSTGGAKLKKSMRGQAAALSETETRPQGGIMKKSLRSQDNTMTRQPAVAEEPALSGSAMRKSMRGNNARQNGQAARPISYQPTSMTEPVMLHKRGGSYDASTRPATATNVGMKQSLRRRGSDSSESSFRRARAGSTSSAGPGFKSTMRGSMRESKPVPSEAVNRSSRFSLRSLSPTPFRRGSHAASPPPPSMGNRMAMKGTLRSGNSSDGSTSRMRIFGRGSAKPDKQTSTRNASRFGDSSDEEDARPAFSSRFADSSDDDEPIPRPASRGFTKSLRNKDPLPTPPAPAIPTRSDSPDLPDSDEEIVQPKRGSLPATKSSTLHRSGSGRGTLSGTTGAAAAANNEGTSATIRPTQSRRGSFMSTILRRKKDPSGKISRDIGESAARRDTRLERSTEQLNVMRTNSGGRLQKRGGAQWPFPEDEDEADEPRRPATSAGPVSPATTTNRPGLLKRRTVSTQGGLAGLDTVSVTPGSPQKKKKFGALRKMFGIQN